MPNDVDPNHLRERADPCEEDAVRDLLRSATCATLSYSDQPWFIMHERLLLSASTLAADWVQGGLAPTLAEDARAHLLSLRHSMLAIRPMRKPWKRGRTSCDTRGRHHAESITSGPRSASAEVQDSVVQCSQGANLKACCFKLLIMRRM